MSAMGHSLPRLPALAPPDVRYASISDQNFAAPRLVAMGHERKSAPSSSTSLSAHPSKELPTLAGLLFERQNNRTRNWVGHAEAGAKVF